jgi:hypothetical protein
MMNTGRFRRLIENQADYDLTGRLVNLPTSEQQASETRQKRINQMASKVVKRFGMLQFARS